MKALSKLPLSISIEGVHHDHTLNTEAESLA